MNLNILDTFLAQAAAPVAATPTQQGPPQILNMLIVIPMMVIAYFILIRPQSKKAKEQAALLKALKAGDKVITSGGVVGVVVSVKENTVALRSVETKLEVLKSAVTQITERAGETTVVESK
jgi:preprotein translocase subunit YajC